MQKHLQTQFSSRQYMLEKDFEIYYYNTPSPTKVSFHAHDYYEFYFFMEGDVSMQIGEVLYPVAFGDMILIPPHIKHRLVIHSTRTPYRRFVFWISQEYCNNLLTMSPDYVYLMQHVETSKNYLFHNDRISFNGISSRILYLIDEMRSDRFGQNAQITLSVNDLILHLNRTIYEQFHSRKKTEESLYQKLCRFIEEHLDEDLSLERLSDEFFVSKYHIAHIFKDSIGLSIHQYITKKRLALCKEALISNASITDTYQSFGFGDYSSFYRAFKKEYGLSPKEWQDMHLNLQ